MGNRLAFVLACTFFNLAFEYSMRGVNGVLQQPLLFPVLFGLYFAFFSMLEDLLARFSLHNYQICLIASLFGLFADAFATRTFFTGTRLVAGVDLGSLLFTELVWWCLLQAIFALYFANRLVRRDRSHPRLGPVGWFLALGYLVAAFWLLARNTLLPPVQPPGWLTWTLLVVLLSVALVLSLRIDRAPGPKEFEPVPLLDILVLVSLAVFLFAGTFMVEDPTVLAASFVNRAARDTVVGWSLASALIFLIWRWRRGREVAV